MSDDSPENVPEEECPTCEIGKPCPVHAGDKIDRAYERLRDANFPER